MNFLVHETLFLYEIKYVFIISTIKKDYLYFETDPLLYLITISIK